MFADAADACELVPRVVVIMAQADIEAWRLRCDPRISLMTLRDFGHQVFDGEGRFIYKRASNEAVFVDHRITNAVQNNVERLKRA